MGGKQSFIKVVSLPYPFSLNAVSFMVASGSSLCLLLRQGRQLRLVRVVSFAYYLVRVVSFAYSLVGVVSFT